MKEMPGEIATRLVRYLFENDRFHARFDDHNGNAAGYMYPRAYDFAGWGVNGEVQLRCSSPWNPDRWKEPRHKIPSPMTRSMRRKVQKNTDYTYHFCRASTRMRSGLIKKVLHPENQSCGVRTPPADTSFGRAPTGCGTLFSTS